jgi:hypothetical protein
MAGSYVGGVSLEYEQKLRDQAWAEYEQSLRDQGYSDADIAAEREATGGVAPDAEARVAANAERQAAADAASDSRTPGGGVNVGQIYVDRHDPAAARGGRGGGSPVGGPNSVGVGGTTVVTPGLETGAGGGSGRAQFMEDVAPAVINSAKRAENARLETTRLQGEAERIGSEYSGALTDTGTTAAANAAGRATVIADAGMKGAAAGRDLESNLNKLGTTAARTATGRADTIVDTGSGGSTSVVTAGNRAASDVASAGAMGASQGLEARKSLIGAGGEAGQNAEQWANSVLLTTDPSRQLARTSLARSAVPQADALTQLEATEGPSAALAALQTGLNRAEQSNLSLSRSGRGWGGQASALARAIDANAGMASEAANQAARIRAEEDAAWRTRRASNLGTAGGLTAQQRALNDSTALAAMDQVQRGTIAGAETSARGAGLELDAVKAAEAAALTGRGLGLTGAQSAADARLGAATTGAGLTLDASKAAGALDLAGTQAQIDAARAAADARARGIDQNIAASTAAGQTELAGAALKTDALGRAADTATTGVQTSGSLLGQGASIGQQADTTQIQVGQVASDLNERAADRDIQKYGIDKGVGIQKDNSTMQLIGAGLGAAATVAPFLLASDRDAKEDIKPASNLKLSPSGGFEPWNRTEPARVDDDPYGLNGPPALGAKGNPVGPGGPEYEAAMKRMRDVEKKDALKAEYGRGLGRGLAAASQNLMGGGVNPYAMGLVNQPLGTRSSVPLVQYPTASDVRAKSNIRLMASDAVSESPGYSFEYKDPERHGDGTFYGPMAQDLEKTPVGRTTVKRGPDGTKMIDTSRLTLVNTAALQELQDEVADMRSYMELPDEGRGGMRDMAPSEAPKRAPRQTYDVNLTDRPRPASMPTLAEAAQARQYREGTGSGWDTVVPEEEERLRPSSLGGARLRRGSDVHFYEPRSNLSL